MNLPIVLQLNRDCKHGNGLRLTKTLTGKSLKARMFELP